MKRNWELDELIEHFTIMPNEMSLFGNKTTQKQKKLIEAQKKLVEEKQKEILDSIHYARRIQNAILPTEKYIDKTLKRLMKNN